MYLKEIQVPIPFDRGKIVIRNGKAVQVEVKRTYSSETKDSRVVRKTIGQVVPLYEDRMYPNENYFALIPNDVPEEIRDPFLLRCARNREKAELRKDPAALQRRVAEGVRQLKMKGAAMGRADEAPLPSGQTPWYITDIHDLNYIRDVFNALYDLMEIYGSKYPDSKVDEYKVEMINRILKELKETLPAHRIIQKLELIRESQGGRTYSDVLMLMTWYKQAVAE